MTLEEEKELIGRAKKEPEAFGLLYDQYYPAVFGYVLKRVANIDSAKDIVSETFFKALKNIWRFKWKNIPFSFWLFRLASNEIVNFFRKNKKAVSLDLIIEPTAKGDLLNEIIQAQEELERHRDFLAIQKNISQLPDKYQEVIALRFFEEKSLKEIGQILGKKEGTVKSLLYRGLDALRKQFPPLNKE